ncbi:SNARE associated Golgi protein-related protein [Desulfobulbus propionicus DSM 2032]|jgi:membrane protein YqaA with SNARE-associated domain|uniref:SNARE associated Golgi protein-related protein n=1 Tax=Desulfobulbus propionicus (strain ATCC 33891 / DSM 2032 / VKM B-1956 / 1pr3) TaxID=577650 RepID=A0A7U4DNX4_DESPD|nr:YqaA family protein [Desulfobulbus propionicus]ADW17469.1 SNARE associated Golgi protein-related protein [Desulfobulbus propionicus DSM 2032]
MINCILFDFSAYGGLFAAALLAATVVPMQSEAVLVGLLLTGDYPTWLLLAVAASGNILGAALNWWLGRGIERFRDRSWFPVSEQRLMQAQQWYQHYGKWSLLLCWMPIVGDPLTVIAGVMREPFPVFLLIAGTAKLLRYLVLAGVTLGTMA